MGCEMKSNYHACNVRNESNLYLMGAVNSNTLAILKFSFGLRITTLSAKT